MKSAEPKEAEAFGNNLEYAGGFEDTVEVVAWLLHLLLLATLHALLLALAFALLAVALLQGLVRLGIYHSTSFLTFALAARYEFTPLRTREKLAQGRVVAWCETRTLRLGGLFATVGLFGRCGLRCGLGGRDIFYRLLYFGFDRGRQGRNGRGAFDGEGRLPGGIFYYVGESRLWFVGLYFFRTAATLALGGGTILRCLGRLYGRGGRNGLGDLVLFFLASSLFGCFIGIGLRLFSNTRGSTVFGLTIEYAID